MRRTVDGLALALVACAPVLGGCQPAWAWGWLLASVCALAVFLAALEAGSPARRGPWTGSASASGRVFLLACLALLAWATLRVLTDAWLGPGGMRAPDLSWRVLAFAVAFSAAFVLGSRWGRNSRRLRTVLRLLFVLAVLLAWIALAQRLGWGPARILGWPIHPQRPSGVYTNANRFAVLLAMGWGCGLALLVVSLGARTHTQPRTAWRPLILALGIGFVAAGIATTLSRLTFFAMALAATGIALVWTLQRTASRSAMCAPAGLLRDPAMLEGRLGSVKRVALVLLPSIACLTLGFTLGGQALGQRVQELAQEQPADGATRWNATQWGWSLLLDEPLGGHGLGRFEAAFRAIQPLTLPKRWDALHNDPLQVGVELGLPGLTLLGVAVGAWWVFWWRARPRRRRGMLGSLLTVAALPVAIPLICSVADFPLREPATGILFAFYAGALYAALARPRAARLQSGSFQRLAGGAGGLLIALCWLAAAWTAGRAGWAASASPWWGRIDPGEPSFGQLEGYAHAIRISPDDPELLYLFARAQLDRMQRTPAERRSDLAVAWQETLDRLRCSDPLDYRTPYLAAAGCEAFKEWGRVLEYMEIAAARAPAYLKLRLQTLQIRLRLGLRPLDAFDPRREEELKRIFGHMRTLLEVYPHLEQGFVDDLFLAGATADEIEPLWAGDEPDLALRRARFWLRFRRWDKAEANLAAVAGTLGQDGWYGALQGRVDLERGRLDRGTAGWTQALNAWAQPEAGARERWMADAVHDLPLPAAQALARAHGELMAQSPALSVALAWRLMQAKDWSHAEALLAAHARLRPSALGLRCWSDLAWALGDRAAALDRAQAAWELSDRSPGWGRWLDQVRSRATQRKP